MLSKAKSIAMQKAKTNGLTQNDIDLEGMEAKIIAQMEESGKTDIEMEDATPIIDAWIRKGLKDSRWATAGAESSQKATTAPTIAVEKVVSAKATPESARVAARQIAVPIAKRTPTARTPRGTEDPHNAKAANAPHHPPAPTSIPGTTVRDNQPAGGAPTSVAQEYPPEIEALLEDERKRAANASARLEIGSTVINTLESVILSLKTTDNKEYLDEMNACLRGALAHFLRTGTTPVPTSLPSRPVGQQASSSGPSPNSTARLARPVVAVPKVTSTWATVAGKRLPNQPAPVMVSRASQKLTPPTKKLDKTVPSSMSDNRLFLRLNSKHQWRKMSPAGIRDAVAQLTNAPKVDIEHVYRVPTGFALRAKNQESRQFLLNAAECFLPIDGKLEEASDIVALRISTVPVAIHTLLGMVPVTEEMVIEEITRVTKAVPVKVRPHGKNHHGALYQSWLAHFKRGAEPRLGFRLFDDSGVAVRHQPRQTVQQCKRCLQFHGTRGCSRAPACWNCTSTMHSTDECHAHTKCRNCGGPHRSDSRACLARPTKSGPVSREQLATIRMASQRDLVAVVRAKAAVRRAEAAAQAAAKQTEAAPGAVKPNNRFEVLITDVTPDATATGTTNPVESS
ncbi:EKA-like protein [Blumeria hordei DH14]|uniref:EKA-like protein n=1 Tax=Blumeria graminis f. sp. hordei (strain DH14) TaxID=546991 RepID=N1JEU2_BLUG1|nr:EKA-like protein [Blumeria hordei DH14]